MSSSCLLPTLLMWTLTKDERYSLNSITTMIWCQAVCINLTDLSTQVTFFKSLWQLFLVRNSESFRLSENCFTKYFFQKPKTFLKIAIFYTFSKKCFYFIFMLLIFYFGRNIQPVFLNQVFYGLKLIKVGMNDPSLFPAAAHLLCFFIIIKT